MLGDGLGEVAHDSGVDVEEVVAGHPRLAGDAGGDDDEVAADEGGLEAFAVVRLDVAGGDGGGVDVRDAVAWCTGVSAPVYMRGERRGDGLLSNALDDGDDIKEAEFLDGGVSLEEESERLTDSAGSLYARTRWVGVSSVLRTCRVGG